MSYADLTDLERELESFATNYYGTNLGTLGTLWIDGTKVQADLTSSYNRINSYLDSIERVPIVPVGTNPKTGAYHPMLIRWNADDTIFTKLKSRHSQEFNNMLPEWMMAYATMCFQIYNDIANEHIILDTDTSPANGIGYPIKVAITGCATFYSNWDSGFYTATDYTKVYHFRINDVAGGTNIGQAYFQISYDDGVSWEDEKTLTATTWISITSGLEIRWQPAGSLGTNAQLALNDEWKVECVPTTVRKVYGGVKFKTFGRG